MVCKGRVVQDGSMASSGTTLSSSTARQVQSALRSEADVDRPGAVPACGLAPSLVSVALVSDGSNWWTI